MGALRCASIRLRRSSGVEFLLLPCTSGMYLRSQVAQNNWPLYHKGARSSLKVAHNCRPLAFQVLLHVVGDYSYLV